MATQLTVTLPDDIYKRVERLAELNGREIEDMVIEVLDSTMPPAIPEIQSRLAVSTLDDTQVMALTDLQMDNEQDRRLSELLDKQQSDNLTSAEQFELKTLQRIYEIGLIRKSEALAEAVKRGLREPLQP